ncbi:conserved repeat domain protein [Desulfatibacillum aliphaticivorans]|uniref:Conserved repeat domain protein n=2 Tax=Desulfatibacillum aliphaticivorans TaxID=218208 RepID=B8FKH5_DESAL|nr:conserved repeat domain protein [Desulfatibacillum aliphaticivorans]
MCANSSLLPGKRMKNCVRLSSRLFWAAFLLTCIFPVFDPLAAQVAPDPPAQSKWANAAVRRLPMTFEPNAGQAQGQVRFIARCPGAVLYFYDNAVDFCVEGGNGASGDRGGNTSGIRRTDRIRMRLDGARPSPQIEAVGRLPGKANYFTGKNPAQWKTGIPTYRKVKYHSVYPGIDLVFYGNPRMLEYDFIVRPGTDPSQIRIAFEGAKADKATPNGALELSAPGGLRVLQHKPVIYQEDGGLRQPVEGGYEKLGPGLYGFELASYDAARPLVIDPALQFSSYIGGTDEDIINADRVDGIAVDADGGVYIGGITTASDFPVISQISGAVYSSPVTKKYDAWVAKVHRSGAFLEWSTLLGGSGQDKVNALALNSNGDVVVVGRASSNFPEMSPLFSEGEFFAAQISGDGASLMFSTRFGGSDGGEASAIAVDSNDNICITGHTTAEDFPVTAGAYQSALNVDEAQFADDAFVLKINPQAGMLLYSSYLGGSKTDWGRGVAVDGSGCIYVAGETMSTDFPTASAYQGAHGGGSYDGFVAKLTANGSALEYSTYLGSDETGSGSASERCTAIALDSSNRAYVTGVTTSTSFPTLNAVQSACGGGADAFVTEFSASGNELVFSTYLGGANTDYGYALTLDASGYIYVAGQTSSDGADGDAFPLVDAIQPSYALGGDPNNNWWDGFVSIYTPGGAALDFSTYLGGNNWDSLAAIAVDALGDVYVGGNTTSQTYPVLGAITFPGGAFPTQDSLQGTYDGIVAKISLGAPVFSDMELSLEEEADPVKVGQTLTYTFTVENKGPDLATNATLTGELSGIFDSVVLTPSSGTCSGGESFNCDLGDIDPASTATVTLTATPARIGTGGVEAFAFSDSGESNTDNNYVSEETDFTPASDLIPDPTFMVFPATETGGRSKLQTFTITNSASVNRSIGQVNFSGANAGEFIIDSDACSGETLSPGAQCSIVAALAPINSGDKEALLNIPSDDPAFPVVEIPVSGEGFVLGPPTIVLRKTGQTTSYATGDDGDLQKGMDWPDPRFQDNGDGTVTDLLTGLMWLKHSTCSAAIGIGTFYYGELTWQQALDFVAGINDGTYDISACGGYTADYTDWRLPNANEMKTLFCGEPTMSGSDLLTSWGFIPWYSPIGGEQRWWTSTSDASYYSTAALYGAVRLYPIKNRAKDPGPYSTSYTQAWPVRDAGVTPVCAVARTGQTKCFDAANTEISCLGSGQDGELNSGVAPPSPRFIDHKDGTVTDFMTHLMWLQNASSQGERTWTSALARIQELNASSYLGYTDWRLPNSEEMASLLDHSNSDPTLPSDHPFSNVQRKYWTSTAYTAAWRLRLNMREGDFYGEDPSEYNYVWPVRGGAKDFYLVDAVAVLQILTLQETSMTSRIKDINDDGVIDLAEAIYIMQSLLEMR